jgi:hypothetical protein
MASDGRLARARDPDHEQSHLFDRTQPISRSAPDYPFRSARLSADRPSAAADGQLEQQAGSGDEQASAKLCCVEIDEVAVAFGPPT